MIAWSSKHINLIVSLFLASFLGAFTTNALCDLEVIEYASTLSHSYEKLNVTTIGGHDDDLDPDYQQSSNNTHTSTDADECCDDAAGIFESSLFSGWVKFQLPLAKFYLAGIIEFIGNIIPLNYFDHIKYHEYDDPPQLNGFGLRVVIQSFLN